MLLFMIPGPGIINKSIVGFALFTVNDFYAN